MSSIPLLFSAIFQEFQLGSILTWLDYSKFLSVSPFEGYLDVGLYDTIKDMAVAALGAIIFCVFAYAFIKTKGKNKIAALFIPTKRNWKEDPPDIEADFANRIAKFEIEMEERRAALDAELAERKKQFENELLEKQFEKSAKSDRSHDGWTADDDEV